MDPAMSGKRTLVAAAASLALLAAPPAVASASAAGPQATASASVKKQVKKLKKKLKLLQQQLADLSQQAGPQGPQGSSGPQGEQGPAGAPGADGSPDTAQQVLDKLLTVDGNTSGLNADTVDGIQGSNVVQGGGQVLTSAFRTAPPHSQDVLLNIPGFGQLRYTCQSGPDLNRVEYLNTGSGGLLWVENEGTSQSFSFNENFFSPLSQQVTNDLTSFPSLPGIADHAQLAFTPGSSLDQQTQTIHVDVWVASYQSGGPACSYAARATRG